MDQRKNQKVKPKKETEFASYVPPDLDSMVREYHTGPQIGEHSKVDELDKIFAWMPGHMNGWYGWANDGKGTFFDFMSVVKASLSDWKFLMMKPEDMSSSVFKGIVKINANNIYNNLVWQYTGKTPFKHYADKYNIERIPFKEYTDAVDWIMEHFYIINPKNRGAHHVLDEIAFYAAKYKINAWLIDPFKSVILPPGDSRDAILNEWLIACKDLALGTNTCGNIIAHPKSMADVKEKDGRYKVVNQFMVAGGAAWDNNLDAQFSTYRCERHLSPSNPKVHLYNLKQRQAELVGVERGVYEDIVFDKRTKRYYFNRICPLDGSMHENIFERKIREQEKMQSTIKYTDEPPF